MKVVAINGSPRPKGNTYQLISTIFEELEKENIETELIQLGGKPVRGCTGCRQCGKNLNQKCIMEDDPINECIAKMAEADGIILGSPVYFANVTTEMKALIDRAGVVSRANGFLLKNKVGASIVALRRGGAVHAFNSMNFMLLANQVILPGSVYWNMGFGKDPGDVQNDEEGLKTMRILAQNMAWLMKKIKD